MKTIGVTVTTIMIIVISTLWSGYVLSVLWGWFVIPVFHLPTLSIPASIGLATIISYTSKETSDPSKDKSFGEVMVSGTMMAIVKPLVALTTGWIVKFWM